jgi:hypothetical protein
MNRSSLRRRDVLSFLILMSAVLRPAGAACADSPLLYGIHWWGYTPGQPIDTTPATLLDAPAFGGWDLETIITHSAAWWRASHFAPLYADLRTNKNITLITRIDYNWGQTVPSPTNPHYANWPNHVVSDVVNVLRNHCRIWIIGNEPNLIGEGNGWPSNQITPAGYATIYRNVRNAIHNNALPSPLGPHIVLLAPVSPGGVIPGVRWMSGTDWLGQTIDNIPAGELDGFAIHSYGGTVADFRHGYAQQLGVIGTKGHSDKPVYMTEWNRYATPGNAAEEAAAAQFCRDAFADVHAWNQDPCNHNIISMTWFVYDADQQAGGGWNGHSIEYWRTNGNPLGHPGNLFTAFEETVDLRYPAGAVGTPGGGTGGMTDTQPGGSNVAPGSAQILTSSFNQASQTGDKAIDGVISAGSKWTSANTAPPHWLALDLGATWAVNGFVVHHAGAGGESTSFNTRVFRIQSGTSINGPWADETVVCNTSQANVTRRSYPAPKPLRFIRLYITDPGIDNYARIPEFEVWASPAVVADFTATPTTGKMPLAVKFTDLSGGSVSAWSWSFGDGGTSTAQNPSHTYPTFGQYTVSLTVTGPSGNSTETREGYIDVRRLGADFDHDGDVDQDDYAHFQRCLTGEGVPQNDPACLNARMDNDTDVDAADFEIFYKCMSGPNVPASPECLN